MNLEIDQCPYNPRKTGHCDHSEIRQATSGTTWLTKCCWCGREQVTSVTLPEHGQHEPKLAKSIY